MCCYFLIKEQIKWNIVLKTAIKCFGSRHFQRLVAGGKQTIFYFRPSGLIILIFFLFFLSYTFPWVCFVIQHLNLDIQSNFLTSRFSSQTLSLLIISDRPWLFDDYDTWVERRVSGPPYRCAAVFCDNSGADIILGVFPFTRDLLMAGTKVGTFKVLCNKVFKKCKCNNLIFAWTKIWHHKLQD